MRGNFRGRIVVIVGLTVCFLGVSGLAWRGEGIKADQTKPCEACSLDNNLPCICILFPFYYTGTHILYYAHRHEDCSNCYEFDPVVYVSTEWLEAEDCESGECPQGSGNLTSDTFHLNNAMPADFDLAQNLLDSANFVVEKSMTGTMSTPTGRLARVKMFELKSRNKKIGAVETLSLGFEVEDDHSPPAFTVTSTQHHLQYRHLYEISLDAQPCVILTTE